MRVYNGITVIYTWKIKSYFQNMRLEDDKIEFLKRTIQLAIPEAKVYLFGSRTDDAAKGGDIDILVLAQEKCTLSQKIDIRVGFVERFGEQKLDIVSFTHNDTDPFKTIALSTAVQL